MSARSGGEPSSPAFNFRVLLFVSQWVKEHPVRAATLGNWFQQGCGLLATAVTIPFVLKHLDAYQAGLWFTFQGWLNVVNLTNFGFSFAISRQTAFVLHARDASVFRERSDFIETSIGWDGVSELYAASRVLFRGTLLAAALLIGGVYLLVPGKSGGGEVSTLPVWTVMGCSLLVSLNVQRIAPFLDGLGYMAYSRGIAGLYQLLWSILAVTALIVHPSLILLAVSVLAASLIQLAAVRLALSRIGRGRLNPRHPVPPGLVKRLFRVAAPVGLVISSGFCVSAIQVPFISILLGVERVAPYYFAQRIGQTLFALFNQVSQSQMPRFTQELGAGDATAAYRRMRRLLILAAFGATGVGALFWICSPALVHVWLGPGHYVDSTVLFFMAVDYALLAFTVPWAWFVLASGRNPFVLSTLSNGVLNLLLIGALAPRLGLLGLPLAGIISGLASNHLYNVIKGSSLLSRLRRQMNSSTDLPEASRYVLLTDNVPLREGGSGISVLGWNWLEAMKDQTALIVAPQPPDPGVTKQAREQCPARIHFHPNPDFGVTGWWAKLGGPAALLLFLLSLPSICRAIRQSGANRLFAFAGARFWFLARVRLLRWCVGGTFEIYLVDDFEAWTRLYGQVSLLPLIRRLEKGTLRRMDRIWAISPGYTRHLKEKYDVSAEWLPVTVRASEVIHLPYHAATPDVRSFVFMGAVNALYRDALFSFAELLGKCNAGGELGYRSRIDIYTYTPRDQFSAEWRDHPEIRLFCQEPDEVRRRAVREAWATLLAFAFQDDSRLMLSTSFSTKFTESLTGGRPVVFYGPVYSTVIEHAESERLPLVATSPAALPGVLSALAREDGPELIARYERVLRRFHSGAALRNYMAEPLRRVSHDVS